MILKNWRPLALAVALTGVVAACGSDSSAADNETTTTTATTTEASAEPFTINLAVDAVGGQNLQLDLGDRQIDAPSEYAEVFVDGEHWMRLYTDWVHLKLALGDHEVRVELRGAEASETLTVPDSGAMHHHADSIDVEGEVPEISLEVTEDPDGGWNLHTEITNFRFAPEHASSEPISGEGHVHVFVDGIKVQRLYGEWWHFADLTPGEHEVSVEVNANNHAQYHHNGGPITASAVITVAGDAMVMPDDTTMSADDGHDDGDHVKVEASFSGGEVTGTNNRVEVTQGETVLLVIDSDVAERVHVHGYDLFLDVGPGDAATLMFTADIPGVFEVEFEDSGVLIAELEVR